MRMRIVTTAFAAFAAFTVASALLAGGTARARDVPETVLITFRPKSGAEQELADVIARHWAEARRLDLVVAPPHLTWRDAGIPDAAPPAILDIWKRMNELVESRDGRPGLVFDVVTVLSPDAAEPSR
jgi:hypothetical protein